VEAAQPGDTVLAADGRYRESLHIEKELTLASLLLVTGDTSHVRATVIEGPGREGEGAAVTVAGADTVTFAGLTITAADDGIYPTAPIRVLSCHIHGTNDAIDFEEGSGGLVADCLIERNVDDALDLDGAVAVAIEGNILRNNDDDGIEIRLHPWEGDSLRVIIADNVIAGNGEDGIQFIGYNVPTPRAYRIENNLLVDNAMCGIGLMDSAETREDYRAARLPERITVVGNTFVNNPVGVSGAGNLVLGGNHFVGCSSAALLCGESRVRMAGNSAFECGSARETPCRRPGLLSTRHHPLGRPGVKWPGTEQEARRSTERWQSRAEPRGEEQHPPE
jgi:nitrous oxidase accessory protein NosD